MYCGNGAYSFLLGGYVLEEAHGAVAVFGQEDVAWVRGRTLVAQETVEVLSVADLLGEVVHGHLHELLLLLHLIWNIKYGRRPAFSEHHGHAPVLQLRGGAGAYRVQTNHRAPQAQKVPSAGAE